MGIFGPSKRELREQQEVNEALCRALQDARRDIVIERCKASLASAAVRAGVLGVTRQPAPAPPIAYDVARDLLTVIPAVAAYIKDDTDAPQLDRARLKADADAIRAAEKVRRGHALIEGIKAGKTTDSKEA